MPFILVEENLYWWWPRAGQKYHPFNIADVLVMTFWKKYISKRQTYSKTTFFRDFLKIRENQTREKFPNSMIIIVEKTRQPRTLDPAESYKAADREN